MGCLAGSNQTRSAHLAAKFSALSSSDTSFSGCKNKSLQRIKPPVAPARLPCIWFARRKAETETEMPGKNILRHPQVMERTGLSAPQIWRLEKAGTFPARVQISAGAVGWFSDEIESWIEARPRGFGR